MKAINRRRFTRTALTGLASGCGLVLLAKALNRGSAPLVSQGLEPSALRPPGALPEEEFLSRCIRCVQCRDACPIGTIRLAGPGDPTAPGTPYIVASEVGCDLCMACTEACPTEALQAVAAKDDVRMGVAVVDERTCVSHNGTGVCGACHTVCPFRGAAITQGLRNAPTVHDDFCVGCGLCEEACILQGTKAIRVFSGREVA